MSRYVACKLDNGEVVVGWDPPLHTYFAQVFDYLDDEDEAAHTYPVRLWVGLQFGEITSADAIADQVKPWTTLSDELLIQLVTDKEGA